MWSYSSDYVQILELIYTPHMMEIFVFVIAFHMKENGQFVNTYCRSAELTHSYPSMVIFLH